MKKTLRSSIVVVSGSSESSKNNFNSGCKHSTSTGSSSCQVFAGNLRIPAGQYGKYFRNTLTYNAFGVFLADSGDYMKQIPHTNTPWRATFLLDKAHRSRRGISGRSGGLGRRSFEARSQALSKA